MQADGTFHYVADFPVDPAASSTSRELDALLFALLRDAAVFAAGKTRIVYWQTDSQVGARVLQIGSRIPELQRKIFLIKSVEKWPVLRCYLSGLLVIISGFSRRMPVPGSVLVLMNGP